jgi:hypothetical protein
MSYSSRFWLYAPLCLLLALAGWVSWHWWNAAAAFGTKLDALKGREAVPGIVISWQSKTVSGFPFRLDAVFTGFSVKGAGAHGRFEWHSEKFALHALTYEAAKTVFEAAGQQKLAWTGADGAGHTVAFLPGSLHASSVMGRQALALFDLDIADASAKNIAAARFQFHMRRDPDGKDLDLMLEADGVRGGNDVKVYATLSNAAAFLPLLRGDASWPDAARAWRAQGGTAKYSQGTDALLSALY